MLKLTLVAVIALVAVSVTPKRNTVTLTKIMRERMNRDHELNMNLMMELFEQLYDRLLEFSNLTPAQRYLRLLDRSPRITEIASYGDIASFQYVTLSTSENQRNYSIRGHKQN